jgi:hypothetical protein
VPSGPTAPDGAGTRTKRRQGVALDRRSAGARRRHYLTDTDTTRLALVDRPAPVRRLRRRGSSPAALYVTPWPAAAVGTYGDAAAAWLRRHLPGWRAMPWQLDALRLVLAHDRRGRILARTALVMVPRQNGKTSLALAVIGWWLDEGPGGTVLGAATERRQARIVYEAAYKLFAADPDLASRARITAHDGIYLGHSWYTTVSREAGSARGFSPALVYFDELLTQHDSGTWDALRYAQAAQAAPLMLATSTAGFADSVVLNELEDRGIRMATGAERADPAFAFLKWGMPEYERDSADAIRAANPGIAGGLLSMADVRAEQRHSLPGSFRRERLNLRTSVAEHVLPPGTWEACQQPVETDVGARWYLGVDAAPGWQRATLSASWEAGEQLPVEVVRDLRGTEGAPISAEQLRAAVLEVVGARPPAAILYESAAAAAPALERLSIDHPELPLEPLTTRQIFDACSSVYQSIVTRRLAHVGDPLLGAQWAVAGKAERDGAFRWTRRRSMGYIDAVMSATMAAYGAARGMAPEPPVQIFL